MKNLFIMFAFLSLAIAGYCVNSNAHVVIPVRAEAQQDVITGKEVITFHVWYEGGMCHIWPQPLVNGVIVEGIVTDGRDEYSLIFEDNYSEGPIPFQDPASPFIYIKSCSVSVTENDWYIYEVKWD